jgi:hypothetical protein
MPTEEEVVDAYLRQHTLKRDEDFWAFNEVDRLVCSDPWVGWRITYMLIKKAPTDEALAYVAAGPLEDLLEIHGMAIIDEVTKVARADKRLQLALSGVWMERNIPVWNRWHELIEEFGFISGRQTAL